MSASNSSKLLLDEQPLQVIPSLAVKLGLNRAMFLQQLHYWLQKSKHVRDGHKWIYNTFEEWHEQFPFWSAEAIRKIARQLQKQGLVKTTSRYNERKGDRTLWYTIDYDALNDLLSPDESTEGFDLPDKSTHLPDKSTHLPDKSTHLPDKSTEHYQRLPESSNRDKDANASSRGNAADAPATGREKQEKAEKEYNRILVEHGKLGKKLSLFVESGAQQRNKTGELKPTTKLRDYAQPFVGALDVLSKDQLSYGLDAGIRNKAKRFGYVLAAAEGYDPEVHERFKRGPAKSQDSVAGSPPELVEALRNVSELKRYAPLAEKFDFTRLEDGQQPDWPIFSQLGGDDMERYRNLQRIMTRASKMRRGA